MDITLIKRLGLPPGAGRTHIGFMGCQGALNALRVAAAFAETEPTACVLVCAVELCSLHFQYGADAERAVANALFADGAAAVVVGSAARSQTAAWRVAASGSCLFPASEDGMTWRVGDHGFEMTLSARVPALIASRLRPWLTSWLGDRGLTLGRVGSWAVHPGGPRILQAVVSSLGLAPEAVEVSRRVLAKHGNMSSPTILFVLDRLQRAQAPRPCVALGFGPGLVAEATLLA